ncbi:hypothetical protein CMEL01_05041 [Colletotrichum melonis]|uniref:Uncharacterized protein n=1 Tax=Colletotrichum melonis TaxID=1209925 RepID=A0AAI9UAE2_9PEZI|nr:hypothetical protein CMEL01_05041 [Colletotrichum melonis]
MAAGLHRKGQSSRLNLSIDSLHWFRYLSASPLVPKLENPTDVLEPRYTEAFVIGEISKGSCYHGRGPRTRLRIIIKQLPDADGQVPLCWGPLRRLWQACTDADQLHCHSPRDLSAPSFQSSMRVAVPDARSFASIETN